MIRFLLKSFACYLARHRTSEFGWGFNMDLATYTFEGKTVGKDFLLSGLYGVDWWGKMAL